MTEIERRNRLVGQEPAEQTYGECFIAVHMEDGSMEWVHEPMQTRVLLDVADMLDENDKLRQENQSIGMASYEVGYKNGSIHYELEHCPACKNVADLQEVLDENAKLRELVGGLEYCVQGLVCDCCPLYDPSSTNHRRCESLERELGVEVDG